MATDSPFDWKLDENHDLVIPLEYTTGLEAVKQAVDISIRLVKGEWFADLDAGLDWYGKILGQKYNEVEVRSEFSRVILSNERVTELVSLALTPDTANRTLTVRYRATVSLEDTAGEISGETSFPLVTT